MPARCRLMNGMREVGLVCDLSTNGCCVVLRSLRPVVGGRILIKTPTLEALSGVIRWAQDSRCGVEFDAPLYEPVVDHLCREYLRSSREARNAGPKTRGLIEVF